jgi:hypothetical protein
MKLVLASLLLLVGCTARSAPDVGPSDARVIDGDRLSGLHRGSTLLPVVLGGVHVQRGWRRRHADRAVQPRIGLRFGTLHPAL